MRQTAEERKQNLLAELSKARALLLEQAASVTPSGRDVRFLGSWSIKDLFAHLIGWDFTNIQAAQDLAANQLPQCYAHHDRDWQTYNAKLVDMHKTDNFSALLKRVQASHQELVDYLQTVPAKEFDLDREIRFKGWKVTLGRLLEAEAKDERQHAEQIKRFVEEKEARGHP